MNLNGYIGRIYKLTDKYEVSLIDILQSIDFQDFKKVYRGKLANIGESLKVIERHLRIKYKK